eukprot:TRINITY_DN35925_c0_g1_i1.p2 TRINITY_DN35925_c0_g1~~TRINITY_DN35925_c0_g1_i1.p2  ORF type:complete len:190 (-),score=38.92 TRINITY_DN35925_c0_g1_i1:88-657(-)
MCIRDRPNVARIEIQTQRINLQFEISDEYIQLVKVSQQEQLFSDILDKEYELLPLLQELYEIGINLMPEPQDAEQKQLSNKQIDVENKAIQEVIFSIRGFAIKSSPLNQDVENDKIVFQIIENPNYESQIEETDEFQWKSVQVWCNKCCLLNFNKQKKLFEKQIQNKTTTHAMLQICLLYTSPSPRDQA